MARLAEALAHSTTHDPNVTASTLHLGLPMDAYCVIEGGNLAHVLSRIDFGSRCACGRKVLAATDDGGVTLRNAPTSERLSSLVLLMAAARKTSAARTQWEARLFS